MERENPGGVEADEHQYINSSITFAHVFSALCGCCVSRGGFERVGKVNVSNEKGAFVDDVNLNPPGEFPWKSSLTEDSFAVQTQQFAFSQRCFCLWTHSETSECVDQCVVRREQVP